MTTTMRIAFIGQGWIGKNYSDDFEERGYSVVRYGLEPQFVGNKELVKECGIVFIAVPTPTTPQGFDDSIVRGAIELTVAGATVVIKSTMQPGVTTGGGGISGFAKKLCENKPSSSSEAIGQTKKSKQAFVGLPTKSLLRDGPADV